MRITWIALVLLAACGDNGADQPAWLIDAHILVDGYDETNTDCRTGLCVHDENTDLTVFGGATYLVHRTAESQILGPNSSLRVSRSDDHGQSWQLLAVIPAPTDRDLRDPCFYVLPDGQLAIKAITRLPVNSTRDSDVDSITVNTSSADAGATWSALAPIGPEMWSFWRVHTAPDGTYYSAAYEDGDQAVSLFSSADGRVWTAGASIYAIADDTPLETELIIDPQTAMMTALVRMDGSAEELLGDQGRLRTKVCTAAPPYAAFDCSGELDGERLDGPIAFSYAGRELVIARKHFMGTSNRKRTALYELVPNGPGTTGTDTGALGIVERGEFPSAGDTSYAGVAAVDDHGTFVVSYYSSSVELDPPWARAMFGPTDIWQATIDLSNL